MKPNFRPIPITIVDFLAVLLPGGVWLVLMASTPDLVTRRWAYLWSCTSALVQNPGWLVPILTVCLALLIGYALKPVSNELTQLLTRCLFRFNGRARHLPSSKMDFPFTALFESKPYYERV